jgi:hypothetical protein
LRLLLLLLLLPHLRQLWLWQRLQQVVMPQQLVLEGFQPLELHQQVLLLRYNRFELLVKRCHGIALNSSNI